MPNLRCLSLRIIPKTLEKNCFSNLVVFKTCIQNSENVHSFISALHMNQQIKKLELDLSFGNYNDLIFSTISELLPELESLAIFAHDMLSVPWYRQQFQTIGSKKCNRFHL